MENTNTKLEELKKWIHAERVELKTKETFTYIADAANNGRISELDKVLEMIKKLENEYPNNKQHKQ